MGRSYKYIITVVGVSAVLAGTVALSGSGSLAAGPDPVLDATVAKMLDAVDYYKSATTSINFTVMDRAPMRLCSRFSISQPFGQRPKSLRLMK